MATMTARVHVWVSGRVQGVCFRDFAQRWASSFALGGWVRNLGDNRVEVLAEGDREGLELLLERLRIGPRAARVENLEVRWEDPRGEFVDFRIIGSYD